MPGRRPEETAAAFAAAAAEVGVDYAFIEGLAVTTWGQPRATEDVDCLLDLPPPLTASFAEALRVQGLGVQPRDFDDARRERSHVTIHDESSLFRVDCKLAITPLEKEQVREARAITISSGTLRIARPEDTIAFKVKFGSPRDLQDAVSILHTQRGQLDEQRLLAFALQLGVAEQLRELMRRNP